MTNEQKRTEILKYIASNYDKLIEICRYTDNENNIIIITKEIAYEIVSEVINSFVNISGNSKKLNKYWILYQENKLFIKLSSTIYFYKTRKDTPYYRNYIIKEEDRNRFNEYYKEYLKIYNKKYRSKRKNRNRINEYNRKRYSENPEHDKERALKYYYKNKEKCKKASLDRYYKNKTNNHEKG